jgi:hypothetical protein
LGYRSRVNLVATMGWNALALKELAVPQSPILANILPSFDCDARPPQIALKPFAREQAHQLAPLHEAARIADAEVQLALEFENNSPDRAKSG